MLVILFLLLIAWAVANETYRRGLWEFKNLSLKRKVTTDPNKKPDEKAPEKKPDEKKKEKDDKKGSKKLGPVMTFFLSVGVWIGVWLAIWLLIPDLWSWFTANPRTFVGTNLIVLLLVGIGFLPLSPTVRVILVIGVITLLITSSNLRGPAWSIYHEAATKASTVKELTKFKTAGAAEPVVVKAPKAPSWSEAVNLPLTSNFRVNSSGQYLAEVINREGKVLRTIDTRKSSNIRGENDYYDLPEMDCQVRFQSQSAWGVEVEIIP